MIVKKQEEVREEEEEPTKIEDIKDQTIAEKTQEGDENANEMIEPVVAEAPVVEEPKVFQFVEQMPEFPGGDVELMKFIQKNVQYPQMERDNDIQGRVILKFVVMEDGGVSDVSVARSVSPGLDKEAVRVVKMLPKFKPGKQQGKAVRVYYSLPVLFKLQ
jgi:protein TonB